MLNYLTQQSLAATAPNFMGTGTLTILAGAGEFLANPTFNFPSPYDNPTWLSLVITNTEAAGSGNDLILSYDNSVNNDFGIVIFPQSNFTLDMRGHINAPIPSSVMAIDGQPWPSGGNSWPWLQNNNATPVRCMMGWLGVL